jgi:hypothetical protein
MSAKGLKGFAVQVVFCHECGETAEGLPDGHGVIGLPVGWVEVDIGKYRHLARDEEHRPTKTYDSRRVYYCSEAHLPASLLPET